MKWNAKVKPPVTESIEPAEPKIGDRKEEVWFAIFPRKCGDKWVWWEDYIAVYEYQQYWTTYEEVVSEGFIFETVRERDVKVKDWRIIERKEIVKFK